MTHMHNNPYAISWREATSSIRGLQRFRQLARYVVLSAASVMKTSNQTNSLRLLYCHYVFDDQIMEFDSLLTQLQRIGEFIDTDTCIEILDGKKELTKNYFHISFDDGFRNIYTNAFPILKKHNIPAIFFVPSSIISASYDVVSNFCLNTTNYNGVIEIASWGELKELKISGIDIGSHTRTHARFSEISGYPAKLRDEIIGSKHELEDRLGEECKYISWPYGTLNDADSKSLEMVKQAGYAACFGAYRGQVIHGRTDRFSIPRHHFEPQWPWLHIKYFALGGRENNN